MRGPDDAVVRHAMLDHLARLRAASPTGAVHRDALNAFWVEGVHIPLVVQQGIRKPAWLEAALAIRTAYTPPGARPPYEDDLAGAGDGFVRYHYRGTDPAHADNRALRAARVARLPLAYLLGVEPGWYFPFAPVWIVGEEPSRAQFVVAVDEGQLYLEDRSGSGDARTYAQRLAKVRLHQPMFRARVLRAYESTCAICGLRHGELLDAAHIVPDGRPRGDAVLPNGLALCKLHHAAFDRNLLGVRPDLVVELTGALRDEVDGPMLRHGLQEMAGRRLQVPRERAARPDRDRLEERYEEFRRAS